MNTDYPRCPKSDILSFLWYKYKLIKITTKDQILLLYRDVSHKNIGIFFLHTHENIPF